MRVSQHGDGRMNKDSLLFGIQVNVNAKNKF